MDSARLTVALLALAALLAPAVPTIGDGIVSTVLNARARRLLSLVDAQTAILRAAHRHGATQARARERRTYAGNTPHAG